MIDGEIYHHLQAAANITVLCKSMFEPLQTVRALGIFCVTRVRYCLASYHNGS
jgi:hypothetical protein